jgi:hypothetical protein
MAVNILSPIEIGPISGVQVNYPVIDRAFAIVNIRSISAEAAETGADTRQRHPGRATGGAETPP